MWRLILSRKTISVLLLAILLGGGLYGGTRLFGFGGGDSEWATLNAELSEALERDGEESSAGKNSQDQGSESDRQKNGEVKVPSSGTLSQQTGGMPGNPGEKSKDQPGVPGSTGKAGQEPGAAAGGAAAHGTVREGGNGDRQQAGNRPESGNVQQEGSSSGGNSVGKSSRGLIDLNTASVSRLTDLPGIGESKARAIVEYRKQNGGFHSPEELMNVKGIGQKTFDKLKELITVSP